MPYRALSVDDCYAFCEAPVRPAVLSTVRTDGRPHSAPVWYVLDGREFVFNTGHDTVKGRNLRRDPRLALCIQDDRAPFACVLVEGIATLDPDVDSVLAWATLIGGRYMGEQRAQQYGARNGVPGELVVRVQVSRISGVRDVAR